MPLSAPVLEDSAAEMPRPLLGSIHSYTRRGLFPLGWAPSPVRIRGEDGGTGQGGLRAAHSSLSGLLSLALEEPPKPCVLVGSAAAERRARLRCVLAKCRTEPPL